MKVDKLGGFTTAFAAACATNTINWEEQAMPVKKVDNVKDPATRIAGQDWQKRLGVPNLTTRELDNALDMVVDEGKSDREIAQEVRKVRSMRKRGRKA